MTEIWPFVALVILQIPLPLSNIFMLIICVGTDIYPALALAYEEAEFDIMTRKPRKTTDHLVTGRLLTHAYGQMGEIATAGGFFTYFVVMEVFGFPSNIVFNLLSIGAVSPVINGSININYNTPYTYIDPNLNGGFINNAAIPYNNPNIPTFATAATIDTNFPNWLSDINNSLDLRGFYLTNCGLGSPNSVNGYCQKFTWPQAPAFLTTTSSITKQQIAFTTETIFYAQSAYFTTIVMVQWSNVFACKSRKVPFLLFRSPSLSQDLTST
jgi:sodium/potassium-transporting ATPase subunit alpha